MIQKVTFIFACLVLFACSGDKKVNIPPAVLPKQKMAEVMLDVHLLEAAMSLNAYNADRVTTQNPAPLFDVFTKHKITKKRYNESFEFYSQHPDLLAEVYQLVLDNLSKMQAEVMNRKEEVKVKIDSTTATTNKIDKRLKIVKKKK